MKGMRLMHPAGLDNLCLTEVLASPPGPGEIRVRVHAAALNFRDALVVKGFFPVAHGLVPLSDGAGEVVDVGEDVTEFRPGDKVVSTFHPRWLDGHMERTQLDNSPGGPADGFACEMVTRPCSHFTRAPTGLGHEESATLTCAGVTAWRALVTNGAVRPGETVLVLGTGGVSLFALQFAKMAGARVIATSSSEDKLARLKALGADEVINYRREPQWGEVARECAGGIGVDHVIEVGGPNTLAQSFAAARTGAHIAIIGAVGGFESDAMPFATVQAKRLQLQAVTVGSRRDQLDMVRAIELHGTKPVIDRTFPLEKLGAALRYLESGQHLGKVCVSI